MRVIFIVWTAFYVGKCDVCGVGAAGDGSNYPPRCARAVDDDDAALGLAAYCTQDHDIPKQNIYNPGYVYGKECKADLS